MTDLRKEFWDRMDDVRAVMLSTKTTGKMVPMSPNVDDDVPGKVWVITAKGTDLAKAAMSGAQEADMVVADAGTGLYAHVTGLLEASSDGHALEEVWSFVADAWFEGGKQDPDICLLAFTPKDAELSITPQSGVKFLYEIAKANLTGDKPDAGAQGVIAF